MPEDYEIEEETLIDLVRRENVLRALADGCAERGEVVEAAGVSESTAYRLLKSLSDRGIAEKVGAMSGEPSEESGYRLTPVGEAVLDETDRFRETVGRLSCMGGIVSSVRESDAEFDPSLFRHGIVTVSEEGQPYAPARRLAGLVDGAGGMRLLAVSAASTASFRRTRRLAEEGSDVEVICSEEVAENFVERTAGGTEGTGDAFSVRVHDDVPLTVALFDERVAVGSHDGEKGTLDVLVDTGSREAYAWGEDVYERYRDEAEAYV